MHHGHRLAAYALASVVLDAAFAAGPLAADPPASSYLLVADWGRDVVRRYDGLTGDFVDTFIPKHRGGINQPWGVLFGPHDGNLYVSTGEFAGPGQVKAVLRYDGVTGGFIDEFTAGGHLAGPRGIIFGPDGHLYVADFDDKLRLARVIRFDGLTGDYLDDFVTAGSGGLSNPTALVFAPSIEDDDRLDLYVASERTGEVLRYDGATGAFRGAFVSAGSGGLGKPVGLAFAPHGDLLVTDFVPAGQVLRYQGPAGSTPGAFIDVFVPHGGGGLQVPFGVIFGPDGNHDGELDLYVTSTDLDHWNGRKASVKRYDGVSGEIIDDFVSARSGGLDDPTMMTFTATDPVTLQFDE